MANYQKPFLKWAGGKTQILEEVLSKFPKQINNYHEIFLGGGSVLLGLLSLQKENKITIKNNIYAYDLNKGLINCYNQIKNNIQDLISNLDLLNTEFTSIQKNTEGQRGQPNNIDISTYKLTREHYYYWIRNEYNNNQKNNCLSAAHFIFLNKTGFKGMYREGPCGFNVPYGKKDVKSIPKIYDINDLKNINKLIQNVEFKCLDFKDSFDYVKKDDFIYLDPPYVPENKDSFVNYTVDGFDLDTHKKLFNTINGKKKDNKFVMSNSYTEMIMNEFDEYNCDIIEVKRRINSKKPDDKTNEVIIYN
tara:strand:- start:43 stop:957 length:915 start_codon:yes stop_codon:yes gene_type:complete